MNPLINRKQRQWVKLLACLVAIIYLTNQVEWAYGYENLKQEPSVLTPALSLEDQQLKAADHSVPLENTAEFLSQTLTLSSVDSASLYKETNAEVLPETPAPAEKTYDYDYVRYDFEDALDLLRPEYASAVIVKDLSKEDLQELLDLDFEVGILALDGEIVLFTSGNASEIRILEPVQLLINKADLIAHTHPNENGESKPSDEDLLFAGPQEEYVISLEEIYGYNRDGNLRTLNSSEYLTRLRQAAQKNQTDTVQARFELNQFIAAMDDYNRASKEERRFFRAQDNPQAPQVVFVSEAIAYSQNFEMVYTVNGQEQREAVTLQAGLNTFRREFQNQYGTTIKDFQLDYKPVLEDGTILTYRNNQLTRIEKAGFVLRGFALDAQGNLTSGSIDTPEGDLITVSQGGIQEIRFKDGRIQKFTNGLMSEYVRPNNLTLLLSRLFDGAGNVTQLTVQEGKPEEVPVPPVQIPAQQMSTSAGMFEFGSNINISGVYQGVRFTQKTAVTSLNFWLSRYGSPSGKIIAKIYENNNGLPGTLVASSLKREASDILSNSSGAHSNGNWFKFDFQNMTELDANKNYIISMEAVAGEYATMGNGSNYIRAFRLESGDPYTNGAPLWYRNGAYTSLTGDWDFKIDGYNGGIPGPVKTVYGVNAAGALLNSSGQAVTSALVPQTDGYTKKLTVNNELTRRSADWTILLNRAQAYAQPSNLPVLQDQGALGLLASWKRGANWKVEFKDGTVVSMENSEGRLEKMIFNSGQLIQGDYRDNNGDIYQIRNGALQQIVRANGSVDTAQPLENNYAVLLAAILGLQAEAVHLTSPGTVSSRNYNLGYNLKGVAFQKQASLQAGNNSVESLFANSYGDEVKFVWSIYSDTFPPKAELISSGIVHTGETELAYTLDGQVTRENVILRAGQNIIRREFTNAWGTTVKDFVIDFQPQLADGTILKYRNGILKGVEKDGLLLENIVLSASNALQSASVIMPNGERIEILNSEVSKIYLPDGSVKSFTGNLIQDVTRPQSLTLLFSHLLDGAGNVTQLTVQEGKPEEVPVPPLETPAQHLSSGSSMSEFASNGNVSAVYQGVRFSQKTAVSSLSFWVSRYQNPSGKLIAKVYENVNGQPGTLVASSLKRNASEIVSGPNGYSGASWFQFDFENLFELQANKDYLVSFETVPGEYFTYGDGANYIRIFRTESGDPYPQGSIYWKRNGSVSSIAGEWNFKVEGYNGGIPGPVKTVYGVNASGALLNSSGQVTASAFVPYAEGYSKKTDSFVQVQKDGKDITPLFNSAVTYKNPPEPPLIHVLSSDITQNSAYLLRYESNGVIHEESKTLTEGVNHFLVRVTDSLGQIGTAEVIVTLDTIAPEMELISSLESNFASYKLRYEVDGHIREEMLNLVRGANEIIREARDTAGNLTRKTFTITYTPFFEEANATYDEADHLLFVEDPASGIKIEYDENAPYPLVIKAQNGQILETLSDVITKKEFPEALKVTLQDDMDVFYENNQITGMRLADGTTVQNAVVDAEGNLQSGEIFYKNGKIQIIRYGKLLREMENNVVRDYVFSGRPVREVRNESLFYYHYVINEQGIIQQVKMEQPDGSLAVYDDQGRIARLEASGGAYNIYEQGRISRLQQTDGSQYVYDQSQIQENGETLIKSSLNFSQSAAPSAKTPLETFYHLTGALAKIKLWDGTEVKFTDGLPSEIKDSLGRTSTFDYLKDGNLLTGLTVDQSGAEFRYDGKGILSQIKTASGTLEIQDDLIKRIFLPDGSIIENFLEDTATQEMISGIVTSPDGTKRTFENRQLVKIETAAGETYVPEDTANGKISYLTKLRFNDGSTANFDHGNLTSINYPDGRTVDQIVMSNNGFVQSAREVLTSGEQLFYQNEKLAKRIFPNGSSLIYENDLAAEYLKAAQEKYAFEYAKNSSGQLLSFNLQEELTKARGFSYEKNAAGNWVLKKANEGHLTASINGAQVEKLDSHFGNIENPAFNGAGELISGTLRRSDGAVIKIANGKMQETLLSTGELIKYDNNRISSLQTAGGLFTLDYSFQPVRVHYVSGGENKNESLAVFLLNLARARERDILLQEPLVDSLSVRKDLLSKFDTGNSVQIAFQQQDALRGAVYQFNQQYQSRWGNLALTTFDQGEVAKRQTLNLWDDRPDTMIDFKDFNGDGMADRLIFDPANPASYKIQLNNGTGFDNPVQWQGIVSNFSSYPEITAFWESLAQRDTVRRAGMEFYEGRHPNRIGELIDINGDGWLDRVQMSFFGEEAWVVQLNNKQNGFDAPKVWGEIETDPVTGEKTIKNGVFPLARIWSFQAKFSSEIWNDEENKPQQELMADLTDMNGDGLLDRVMVAPREPYDYWLVQFNNGSGFEFPILWKNVVNDFYFRNHALDGALALPINSTAALLSDLIDMNGDGKPDRVFTQLKNPDNPSLGTQWMVQLNNGKNGFENAVLWDNSVRGIQGTEQNAGTSIYYSSSDNRVWINMMDINGDGLKDRVTAQKVSTVLSDHQNWWVELNNGHGFEDAVIWSGVETQSVNDIGVGSDGRILDAGEHGTQIISTELTDVNGDDLPDRVIYQPGNNQWLVQFNNGHGFEPLRAMTVDSLIARTGNINPADYDSIQLSVRLGPPAAGGNDTEVNALIVKLGSSSVALPHAGSQWQDYDIPLCKQAGQTGCLVPSAANIEITAVDSMTREVYVDNISWIKNRAVNGNDWLRDLLLSSGQIPAIFNQVQQQPQQILSVLEAKDADWGHLQDILQARTVIRYSTAGEVTKVETADKRSADVASGKISQILNPDGSRLELSYDTNGNLSQSANYSNFSASPDAISRFSYGKVREVTRTDKPSLKYSYEYDSEGNETMVVEDPLTGNQERYRSGKLVSVRKTNGLEHTYAYGADGKIIASQTYYKGVLQEKFGHDQSEGRDVVIQESGVREEYGADGKLLYHQLPNGLRYRHEYVYPEKVIDHVSTNADGVEIHQLEVVQDTSAEKIHRVILDQQILASGNKAFYEGSEISQILFHDGTRVFFETVEIGNQKIAKTLIVYADGIEMEFENGNPKEVRASNGVKQTWIPAPAAQDDPLDFHLAEARKAYASVLTAKDSLKLADDVTIIGEFDLAGNALTQWSADGLQVIYNSLGKAAKVIDKSGNVQSHYDYDSNGALTKVTLDYQRKSLPDALAAANAEIESQRVEALMAVAERNFIVHETIEGSYEAENERLRRIRSQLEGQRTEIASIVIPKKAGAAVKNQISGILGNLETQIAYIDNQIAELARIRANALKNLDSKLQESYDLIQTQVLEAKSKIAQEQNGIEKEIIRQELTPVISDHYRTLLGRDPSGQELNLLIQNQNYNQPFDAALLKQNLMAGTERQQRIQEVSAIKAAVIGSLESYSSLNSSERDTFLANLGLTASDIISLDQPALDRISNWLNQSSLHFGQSAFLALEALLKSYKPEAYSAGLRVSLAHDLILTDILKGILTGFEKGDLLISQFAMRRYAANKGLNLNSYHVDFTALRSFYLGECGTNADCEVSIVAHVDENHYIIIKKVTADAVIFSNPGHGPEDNMEKIEMNRDDFLKTWEGRVLTARGPPSEGQAISLTQNEEMRIRGAFFGLFSAIFAPYVFLTGFIVGRVFHIETFERTFSIENIKQEFTDLFNFMKAMFAGDFPEAFRIASENSLRDLELIANDLAKYVPGIGKLAQKAVSGLRKFHEWLYDKVLNTAVFRTVVDGIKIVAGVVLAIPTGGASLALVGHGLSGILSRHTDLNPLAISLISAAASLGAGLTVAGFSAVGANGAVHLTSNFSVSNSLKFLGTEVGRKLTANLAMSGVVGATSAMGMNPLLGNLIALPLSSGISGFTSSLGVANQINSISLMAAIKNGFAAGAKSIGFNFSGSGANGLSGSFSANSATQSIESSLGKQGLFSSVLNVVKATALAPYNAVSGLTHLALNDVRNFQSIIQEKGLGGALESFATSIFNKKTLEQIVKAGGMAGFLGSASETSTTFNGQQAKELKFGSSSTSLFFDIAGKLIGKKEEGTTQAGTFGTNAMGSWGLISGTIMSVLAGGDAFAGEIANGQLTGGSIYNSQGQRIIDIKGNGSNTVVIEGQTSRDLTGGAPFPSSNSNSSGGFWDAIIKFIPYGMNLMFESGKLKETNTDLSAGVTISDILNPKPAFIFGNGFNNTVVPLHVTDTLIPAYQTNLIDDEIVDPLRMFTVPMYEITNLFGNMLDWASNYLLVGPVGDAVRVFLSAIENSRGFFEQLLQNQVPDSQIPDPLKPWAMQLRFWSNQVLYPLVDNLTDKVVDRLKLLELSQGGIKDGIAFSHSGFFAPLIGALEKPVYENSGKFDVHTVINYEGVFPVNQDNFIDNPNLKRIINVWGTAPNDFITGQHTGETCFQGHPCVDETKMPIQVSDFGPPKWSFDDANFSAPSVNFENINIEIVGARHNDFAYREFDEDTGEPLWNAVPLEPEARAKVINQKTNEFMRQLYERAVEDQTTPGVLENFLATNPNVSYNAATKFATVNFGVLLPYEN